MNDLFQIKLKNVTKNFEGLDTPVLNNLSFNLNASGKVAILGSSGSGKSTLLHIIAGLDSPSKGKVFFNNLDMASLSDNKMAKLRNRHIGFIYQSHHLLSDFSSIENVMMPLIVRRGDYSKDFNQAKKVLKILGLGKRLNHFPYQLSGGERQRVAIARAMVTAPNLILADEPTGNLDHKNANLIFDSFLELADEFKTAIVLVTHDLSLAKKMKKNYRLASGKLKSN
jgi:lipoprotein-releasing system ATP-binding protein